MELDKRYRRFEAAYWIINTRDESLFENMGHYMFTLQQTKIDTFCRDCDHNQSETYEKFYCSRAGEDICPLHPEILFPKED